MYGVILAAGIGSRLRPLTLGRPKSCVSVAGTPILEQQLEAYDAAGVEDVFVVAGYLADDVVERCRAVAETSDVDVTVVTNDLYANTDNLYSLSLLEDALAGVPFILTNGDVVFDEAVLRALHLEADGSAIACDTSAFSDEAMKITVDADGTVDHIAKDIGPEAAYASSIDAYRFSASFSATLFEEATRLLDAREEYSAWTELAVDTVLAGGDHAVEPVDIAGASWVEIDDEADLLRADRAFSRFDVTDKEVVFIDLDGTLYLDDEAIDGAADLVAGLRDRGVDVFFLSNNSSRWKTDYVETLERAGIPARPEDIVLSTDGVIDDLENRGVEAAFVVGTEAFRDAVRRRGIDPTADEPEVVVVGFDTELTYEKVRRATLAIRDGAPFLLAHPDLVCPTADGFVPDCGSIGALVESATGRGPDAVFGKPNAAMVQPILAERSIDPSQVAVVGDRLETEGRMAEAVGCDSVIVLTGDADRRSVEESDLDPALVVRSVADIAC
ncbi:HAD-IIA family hydrolase [Haloarcula onubensis]|uniref:HAD-IIA family hydrolase n=1 Tax=Haloarcula onubensis TaxID=2950539 RepID=A0ABU2FQK5_9EURY|nr:HAD-IIA family hydrolase [Halomicroarcula sp. S3CR25-11]MDS0283043.1 HAD-IIA family hydrolase [Halomicroarcula sp. S3CR25-11]